jgi:hypothetical protein
VTEHLGWGSRAIYWDDMVNPDQNGGEYDHQLTTGGGRPGWTDGALLQKIVKPEVIWFSWAYDTSNPLKAEKTKDAPKLFGRLGYDWVGSPYLEASDVRAWAQSLKAGKAAGFGDNALASVWWTPIGTRELPRRSGATSRACRRRRGTWRPF